MNLYDYAEVSLKRRRKRDRRRLRYLILALFIAFLFVAQQAFYSYYLHCFNSCRFSKALSLTGWAKVLLFYRNLDEPLALAELLSGKAPSQRFAEAEPVLDGERVISCLYKKGRGREVEVYGKFLQRKGRITPEYVAQLACSGRWDQARELFSLASGKGKKWDALAFIFKNNIRGTVASDMTPVSLGSFAPSEQGISVSTLLPRVHSKIQQLFSDLKGAVLVLSPEGAVLGYHFSPSDIYLHCYELGSVFKLVSAVVIGKRARFPYTCKGYEEAGGKIVYDWMRHGLIQDLQAAIARSCNSLFARYGKELSPQDFREAASRLGLLSELKIGRQKIPSSEIAASSDPYRLARLSAGLEGARATVFHAAQIAIVFANRGVLYRPYLIKERRNCLLRPVWRRQQKGERVLDEATAERIAQGMARAVEEGTGRKTKLSWAKVALKTGSTGKKPFDAWVVGFVPYEEPKIVFVLFMPSSGRADIVAVPKVRLLLEALKDYILED